MFIKVLKLAWSGCSFILFCFSALISGKLLWRKVWTSFGSLSDEVEKRWTKFKEA